MDPKKKSLIQPYPASVSTFHKTTKEDNTFSDVQGSGRARAAVRVMAPEKKHASLSETPKMFVGLVVSKMSLASAKCEMSYVFPAISFLEVFWLVFEASKMSRHHSPKSLGEYEL